MGAGALGGASVSSASGDSNTNNRLFAQPMLDISVLGNLS